MTNEELVRLDQRVLAIEARLIELNAHLFDLDNQVIGLRNRVDTWVEVYNDSMKDWIDRLFALAQRHTGNN